MSIQEWYLSNFEDRIKGRFVTLDHLNPILDSHSNSVEIFIIGTSENGIEIPCLKIGEGEKVVLGWSQMHGNESTTTKGMMDFIKFLNQKSIFQDKIDAFLSAHTFYLVPILNPDGAKLYTRENTNGIDLNRDAKNLSQSESKALDELFHQVRPELCLNLHDQRSIYGLEDNTSAVISFLSPSADENRTLTASRKVAMEHIVRINHLLQRYIPGSVGRYDDSYNTNCVGDTFQEYGVPTILFEAGHFPGDYQRVKTREYIFYAYLALFGFLGDGDGAADHRDYFDIPENHNRMYDVILRDVKINGEDTSVNIAIQFQEELQKESVIFVPIIEEIGDLDQKYGHREIDGGGAEILLNSYENVFVNEKVLTIVDKNAKNRVFFKDF